MIAPVESWALYRACFDCEVPLRGAVGAFCATCERHRADGHKPAAVFVTVESEATGEAVTRPEYCHGAGPNGLNYALLDEPEMAIYIERKAMRGNPHFTRVPAGLGVCGKGLAWLLPGLA